MLFRSGCGGGYIEPTVVYMKTHKIGLCTESAYPYTGKNGVCKDKDCTAQVYISGYDVYPRFIETDQPGVYTKENPSADNLAKMVDRGPTIAILRIASGSNFSQHSKNVALPNEQCSSTTESGVKLDQHAVIVYGYDETNWLVYNSYGNTWGPNGDGTAKIPRTDNWYCINTKKHIQITQVSHTTSAASSLVQPAISNTINNYARHTGEDDDDHDHHAMGSILWIIIVISLVSVMVLISDSSYYYYPSYRQHVPTYSNVEIVNQNPDPPVARPIATAPPKPYQQAGGSLLF